MYGGTVTCNDGTVKDELVELILVKDPYSAYDLKLVSQALGPVSSIAGGNGGGWARGGYSVESVAQT